jgi:CO/xanthine dehydrogenase FAD-binding subunit
MRQIVNNSINYFLPASVADAVDILVSEKGSVPLAGGTDLMVELNTGEFKGSALVDLGKIRELKELKIDGTDGADISIGSMVTIEELRSTDLVRCLLPALAKAADNFAGQQIRNQATIGGNVAHAAPCGDTHPPLILYGAKAEVAGSQGRRLVSVEELLAGPNKSALKTDEILVKFFLKPEKGVYAEFQKIGRRKDLAISRISMAVMVCLTPEGFIGECRVVAGAIMPTTRRLPLTENFLIGKEPSLSGFKEAAKILAAEIFEVAGRRSSAAYKEPAVQGLFLRAFLPLVKGRL